MTDKELLDGLQAVLTPEYRVIMGVQDSSYKITRDYGVVMIHGDSRIYTTTNIRECIERLILNIAREAVLGK